MRTRFLLALSVLVAATGLLVPAASAAPAPGCGGYWHDEDYAYYTHCGPTSVLIDVDVSWGQDFTRCVGPNSTTNIGLWPRTTNAWYVRPC